MLAAIERSQRSAHPCDDAVPVALLLLRILQIEAMHGTACIVREVAAAVIDRAILDARDRKELWRHPLIGKGSARELEVLAEVALRRVTGVVALRVDRQQSAAVSRLELTAHTAIGGSVSRREHGARNVELGAVFQFDEHRPLGIERKLTRRHRRGCLARFALPDGGWHDPTRLSFALLNRGLLHRGWRRLSRPSLGLLHRGWRRLRRLSLGFLH